MADDSLQAEVERLRAEVETHRQRELSELRSALAAALVERENYRSEAYRNAELGRQIDAAHQETINKLASENETLRKALGATATARAKSGRA